MTGALLATMYIGFLSARAISDEGAFAKTAFGRRIGRTFSLDESGLDQLALVLGVAINIFIVVIGLPLVLFLWGFQPGDISAALQDRDRHPHRLLHLLADRHPVGRAGLRHRRTS